MVFVMHGSNGDEKRTLGCPFAVLLKTFSCSLNGLWWNGKRGKLCPFWASSASAINGTPYVFFRLQIIWSYPSRGKRRRATRANHSCSSSSKWYAILQPLWTVEWSWLSNEYCDFSFFYEPLNVTHLPLMRRKWFFWKIPIILSESIMNSLISIFQKS